MNEIKKTNTMKLIERMYDKQIEDILRIEYIDNHLSIVQLGQKLGVSVCTAQNWLVLFQIPRRKIMFV